MIERSSPAPAPQENAQDVRAGETRGRMRYVLGISLALAVIALAAVIWGPVVLRSAQ